MPLNDLIFKHLFERNKIFLESQFKHLIQTVNKLDNVRYLINSFDILN